MRRALLTAIVFWIATVPLVILLEPSFLFGYKTIGEHDVDLSKGGEVVLPIPDVSFCCGSQLLLFLESPVKSDREAVARELLKTSGLSCEILVPDEETVAAEISNNPSWSGVWATKRLLLGRHVSPRPGEGRSLRLKVADGCQGLSGMRQTIVLKQTPCGWGPAGASVLFMVGGLVTAVVAAIALINALFVAVKNKLSGKKKPNKAIPTNPCEPGH
jgi:hypothetical protein